MAVDRRQGQAGPDAGPQGRDGGAAGHGGAGPDRERAPFSADQRREVCACGARGVLTRRWMGRRFGTRMCTP